MRRCGRRSRRHHKLTASALLLTLACLSHLCQDYSCEYYPDALPGTAYMNFSFFLPAKSRKLFNVDDYLRLRFILAGPDQIHPHPWLVLVMVILPRSLSLSTVDAGQSRSSQQMRSNNTHELCVEALDLLIYKVGGDCMPEWEIRMDNISELIITLRQSYPWGSF